MVALKVPPGIINDQSVRLIRWLIVLELEAGDFRLRR
jgi:hypothetical protein